MIHGLPTRCRHALYDDHKDLSIVEIMYWHGPLNQKGTVVKKNVLAWQLRRTISCPCLDYYNHNPLTCDTTFLALDKDWDWSTIEEFMPRQQSWQNDRKCGGLR